MLIANVSQMFDKIPCTAMELRLTADLKFARLQFLKNAGPGRLDLLVSRKLATFTA